METIDVLERKLHTARRGVPGAKYQTSLVIDLNGPSGNIFYLMGVCNRLMRELGLSLQLKREYETEVNSAGDYQSRLSIMRNWFGGITPKTILIYGDLFIRIQKNKKESP